MTALPYPALAILALLAASGAAAETCPAPSDPARRGVGTRASCPPRARTVEPYDPDRVRAGGRPGFVDLGGGSEVRIGGRARMDYDARR